MIHHRWTLATRAFGLLGAEGGVAHAPQHGLACSSCGVVEFAEAFLSTFHRVGHLGLFFEL